MSSIYFRTRLRACLSVLRLWLHTHAEHAHAYKQTPRGEQELIKSAREIAEAVRCAHALAQAPSRSPNAEKSEGPSPLCVTVSMQEMEEEFRKRQEERKKSDKKRIVTEAEGDLLV